MAEHQAEPSWEELLGSNNWDSLLDPLHLSLRRLIIRAGDFCQATYDAFVNDKNSKYCGASRYGKRSFFQKVMLDSASDYQVYCFLYATARLGVPEAFLLHSMSRDSWDRESNWIGYIAITSDERTRALGRREIYVALRGTTRTYEWVNVLGAQQESIQPILRPTSSLKSNTGGSSSSSSDDEDDTTPEAMAGWVTIYTSDNPNSQFTKLNMRTQLLTKIRELIETYKNENPSVVLTGHSLGASLAVLAAFDLVENGVNGVPVTAIVFGCPQVGNKAFDERSKQYANLKVLHVRNIIDLITHYPGRILGYVDPGIDLVIDTRKSPFLKDSKFPGDWHNLQAMLHVVAGWTGEKNEFDLKVKRSLALVNKSCEYLKDECLVPGSWWIEKNKGFIKTEDGEWVMAPRESEDLPVPEF